MSPSGHHLGERAGVQAQGADRGAFQGLGGNRHRALRVVGQPIRGRERRGHAVGLHSHAAAHGIGETAGPVRPNGKRAFAEGPHLHAEAHGRDLARTHGQFTHERTGGGKPVRGLQLQAHGLRLVQVGVHGHRDIHAVVLGQVHGQVHVHEERLEHADAGLGGA